MIPWIQKNIVLAIIIGTLSAAVATESAIIVRQARKNGALKEKVETVKRDLEICRGKLGSLQVGFDTLETAHGSCMKTIAVSLENQKAAIDQIDSFKQNITDMSQQVRATRNQIYKEANCNALAKMDIAAACPALAASLRERAAIGRSRTTD